MNVHLPRSANPTPPNPSNTPTPAGKLIGVIGDEDTVTGFLLAGVGHRTTEGANFLVVKPGAWGPLVGWAEMAGID